MNTGPHDGSTAASPTLPHGLRYIIPVLFLLLTMLTAWHEISMLDLHDVRLVWHTLPTGGLILLAGSGLLAVLAMTAYDWILYRTMGIDLPLKKLTRYSWVANSFNNLIGLSGLAGSGIRLLLLSHEEVNIRKGVACSAWILIATPLGLSLLCWPQLLSGAPVLARLPLPSWLGHLGLALFAAYLPLLAWLLRSTAIRMRLGIEGPHPGRLLATLTVISSADWLLAAGVAWGAFYLTGAMLPPLDFIVVFSLAAVAGVVSLVPGGLGVFDGVLLLLLTGHGNASGSSIVTALLLYRIVYYVIPWLIGVYLGAGLLVTDMHRTHPRLLQMWREYTELAMLRLPLAMLIRIGVRVLSYLTFAAGVVLLISAAFPTLGDRLELLSKTLPLPAVEASHLLSVGVGVLLIALSKGIAEQVRSAYRVVQILLLSGALFSLIKGVDYEEALALLFVFALLRQQQSRFYRQSFPIYSPRNLIWLTGLAITLLGYTLLGDWVHGAMTWRWENLLAFSYAHEAPRFVRSLIFALLVALTYLGWSFFRSPAPVLERPAVQMQEEARLLLERYGGGDFGHLLFLGDKYLFWSQDRRAIIQFGKVRDRFIALGDPLGDSQAFGDVILQFREFADLHDFTPVFYEVSEPQLHRYHDCGFALFKLGEMAYVNLTDFTLAGRHGEALRHSVNRAKRNNLSFELLSQPFSPEIWPTLRNISDAWLQERKTAEKGFSLGYYNENYLALAPIGIIRHEQHIVAFANLLPDYASRQVLSVDLMRYRPGAPPGVMDLLFVELMQWGQQQGYQYFNLGMAPLAGVGESRFARAGEKVMQLAYRYGNRFYNYKGLRSYKEKFHPEWRSAYLAYPIFTPLPPLLVDTAALIAGGYRRIFFQR